MLSADSAMPDLSARIDDAVATFRRGDHAAAMPLFASILAEDHNLPVIHRFLGECYRIGGLPQRALEAYGSAAATGDASFRLWSAIGLAHEALGSADRAELSHRRALDMAHEQAADASMPACRLASLLHREGRGVEAKAILANQYLEDPHAPDAHVLLLQLAVMEADGGDPALFDRVVWRLGEHVKAWTTRAGSGATSSPTSSVAWSSAGSTTRPTFSTLPSILIRRLSATTCGR